MHSHILFSLLAATATAAPTALDIANAIMARAPVGSNPVLKSATSSGTGCAPNTAAFVFQDDATVAFDAMVLSSDETDKTKTCTIVVDIGLDAGWKFTAAPNAVLHGYGEGPSGFQFDVGVKYAANGVTSNQNCHVNPASTINNHYVCSSYFVPGPSVSSACGGGKFTIETQLKVAASQTGAYVTTVDSADIAFTYTQC